MSKATKIGLTPITENKLLEVGFEKVIEKDREENEYHFVIRLPKDSPDPHCMCLISSYSTEWKELKLQDGQYLVEMYDTGGLGTCFSMEEVDMLYFVLTKKNLYDK